MNLPLAGEAILQLEALRTKNRLFKDDDAEFEAINHLLDKIGAAQRRSRGFRRSTTPDEIAVTINFTPPSDDINQMPATELSPE